MDLPLKLLVYRACLAAVWSDRAMSEGERTHLAALVETLADGEEEREALRRETLREVKPALVLEELAKLDPATKRAAFEECLDLLKADRRLNRADLRFLGRLRRVCGVGLLELQGRLLALWWHDDVRVFRWKTLGVAACLAGAAFWAVRNPGPAKAFPKERSSGLEVLLGGVDLEARDPKARYDGEWVYRLVRDSVVLVEVFVDGEGRWSGSGSVIGGDRDGGVYVITNKHVVYHEVDEAARIEYRVRFLGGGESPARLDFYSRETDLALLRLESARAAPRPAPLLIAPREQLRVGQSVYALGNPKGLRHTFTAGIVSALREDYLQTDATVDSGSSGGPLIDGFGRLCGVVTKAHNVKNYSFALYPDAVLRSLQERRRLAELR